MADSSYSLKLITSPEYQKLSEMLFSLAVNDDVKEKMKMVLYEGKLTPEDSGKKLSIKSTSFLEAQNRVGYAYLLATHPETFDLLVNNNVNLFHGTGSIALPHILKYGLQSTDKQVAHGSYPEGGEAWSRQAGTRDFISFTDSLDIAIDYAEMNVQNLNDRRDIFGAFIGIRSGDIPYSKKFQADSSLPEIGVKDEVPTEKIQVIRVPEGKVRFTKKLVQNSNIQVSPFNMDDRFFWFDHYGDTIYIDDEKFIKIQQEKSRPKNPFSAHSLNKLAASRSLSNLFGVRNLFKNIGKGKSHEDSRENI